MNTVSKFFRMIEVKVVFKFAPYVVVDSNNTKQYAWSLQSALAWLPYCASGAVVIDRKNLKLAARLVSNGRNSVVCVVQVM